MDECEDVAEEQARSEGPALSSAQQAHQVSYEQNRARVRCLQVAAVAKRDAKDFRAALKVLCEAADQLCLEAEDMPAWMDEEAQARSLLLVRSAGRAGLALAGVLVVLIVFGALSGGWWSAVILMAVSGVGLLRGSVTPPGTAHQRQRVPALASPALGAVAVLIAVLTSWWWVAVLLFVASGLAVIVAVSPKTCGPERG